MPVQLEQFKLRSIIDLDPRVESLFEKHVSNMAQDCMNRPGDKTPRKVILEFAIVPAADQEGNCDRVDVTIETKSKVPTFRTPPYPMIPSKAGLRFNRDVPDTIDQPVLFNKDEIDE